MAPWALSPGAIVTSAKSCRVGCTLESLYRTLFAQPAALCEVLQCQVVKQYSISSVRMLCPEFGSAKTAQGQTRASLAPHRSLHKMMQSLRRNALVGRLALLLI